MSSTKEVVLITGGGAERTKVSPELVTASNYLTMLVNECDLDDDDSESMDVMLNADKTLEQVTDLIQMFGSDPSDPSVSGLHIHRVSGVNVLADFLQMDDLVKKVSAIINERLSKMSDDEIRANFVQ